MTHRLKTLGLAAIAVLAMSAVVASAAHAQFTASKYPTSATATSAAGNDDFITEAGSVQCHGAFTVGPLNAASNSVTVQATYSGCSGIGTTVVHMNGCDFVWYSNGELNIECGGASSVIEFTAGPCEFYIPPHTGLTAMTLKNGSGDITSQANVKGIVYVVTKDGFLCPFNGTGIKLGAEYRQNNPVTVQSTNGASISVD